MNISLRTYIVSWENQILLKDKVIVVEAALNVKVEYSGLKNKTVFGGITFASQSILNM